MKIKEKLFLWVLEKKLKKLQEDNNMKKLFDFFNGRKTMIGLLLFFIEGGLAAIGHPMPILKEIALGLGAVGSFHKVVKGS